MKTTGCARFRFASGEVRSIAVGGCCLGLTDMDGNRPVDYTLSVEITGRWNDCHMQRLDRWIATEVEAAMGERS